MGPGGAGGGSPETHAAVYRADPGGAIHRLIYTPLGNPTSLGGNLAPGSAPWGYLRADGVAAVLYIDVNRHVHEITPVSSPFNTVFTDLDYNASPLSAPLAAAAPVNGPVPDVIGYVRSDGRSAVVYRDTNNHVIEILRNSGGPGWSVSDLTMTSGAQVTATKGSAFPYVRSDGYNTIVYIASDNHIHELANLGSWYGDGDLSAATGDTLPPATDPWGYVRSDNYNCVVYVSSDGRMHELALYPGGYWGAGYLPAVSPQVGRSMRPSGYVRNDGVNAVVYVGLDGESNVHELVLLSSGWSDSVLATPSVVPASQLFGHRATGNRNSILFRGTNEGDVHAYELSMPAGGAWSLQEF